MYGIEESTGLGGLAAQAPGGNQFLASAMRIQALTSGAKGAGILGATPSNPGAYVASGGGPQVAPGGSAVELPVSQQTGNTWRDILNFHNSPAPWILIAILLIYGWTHVSYRARGTAELGIARG